MFISAPLLLVFANAVSPEAWPKKACSLGFGTSAYDVRKLQGERSQSSGVSTAYLSFRPSKTCCVLLLASLSVVSGSSSSSRSTMSIPGRLRNLG